MWSWLLVNQEDSITQLCEIIFRRQYLKSKIWSRTTLAFLIVHIWKFFMFCHSICVMCTGAWYMILVGQREQRGLLGSSFLRAMTMTYEGSHSIPPWHFELGKWASVTVVVGILPILYCRLDYHLAKIIEHVFENSRNRRYSEESSLKKRPWFSLCHTSRILLVNQGPGDLTLALSSQRVWIIPEAIRHNGIWDIWLGPLGLDYFQILSLL